MPQLMPLYWVNSVFMGFCVVMTLVFFYFYEGLVKMTNFDYNKESIISFNFLW